MKKTMSKMTALFMMFTIFFFAGVMAFAQEVSEVSDLDFIQQLLSFVSGYKGLTGLALAAAAVQLVIMLLKTPLFGKIFKSVTGQIKLLIVSGLSLIAGVIALRITGLSLAESLLHSSTLAAFQVFAHQIYLQFFVKKD